MAIKAPQLTCFLIHQINKQRNGVCDRKRRIIRSDTSNATGHHICGIIPGGQQHCVQQTFKSQPLPLFKICKTGMRLYKIKFITNRKGRIQIAIIAGNCCSQQFGYAGRIRTLGTVFGIKHRVVCDII